MFFYRESQFSSWNWNTNADKRNESLYECAIVSASESTHSAWADREVRHEQRSKLFESSQFKNITF